jgi:hypothetical protein
MIVIKGNFRKEDAQKAIEHTKKVIAGLEPDTYGLGLRFWSAVSHSLFTSIFDAFLVKSNHGTDDLGLSWKDLSPEYKAYGRPDARRGLPLYDNRAVRTPSLRVRPTLNPSANRAWGGRWFALYLYLQGEEGGKEIAGGNTWDLFKAKGYPTLIGLMGNLKLPLLNRTGILQRSLFPAPLTGGLYIPLDKNQIFKPENGKLTIGTKRPHIGDIDKERPIWPKSIKPWLDKATAAGRDAIVEYLPTLLEQIKS